MKYGMACLMAKKTHSKKRACRSARSGDKQKRPFPYPPPSMHRFPFVKTVQEKGAYRTFRVGFYTDEVRHCLVSSVFYPFPKKIKGGQNELVKSPKMIAMTALIRVISF